MDGLAENGRESRCFVAHCQLEGQLNGGTAFTAEVPKQVQILPHTIPRNTATPHSVVRNLGKSWLTTAPKRCCN